MSEVVGLPNNEISEELNTLLFKSVHKFIRQLVDLIINYPQP